MESITEHLTGTLSAKVSSMIGSLAADASLTGSFAEPKLEVEYEEVDNAFGTTIYIGRV